MTNNTTNATVKKSIFTVKNVLRSLALLCIIFVFCPAFLVSCSGQTINVSVMTAVGGLSMYGDSVVDPQPVMLVCLLIPVVSLILLFRKKMADKKVAGIVMAINAINVIVWFIFKSAAQRLAADNLCTFKTTGVFAFNMIAMVLIVGLSLLVIANKLKLNTDLLNVITGGESQGALDRLATAVSRLAESASGRAAEKADIICYCSNCGVPVVYGSEACSSCGTAVPESVLTEAAEARKESAPLTFSTEFCKECGDKLKPEAAFCEECGTKI